MGGITTVCKSAASAGTGNFVKKQQMYRFYRGNGLLRLIQWRI